MRNLELGRLLRTLRRRGGWRQQDCAERAQVHRSTWSLMERGRFAGMTVAMLQRCAAELEVTLDIVPHWRGAELAHLRDEDHATLLAAWADRLRRWGWDVRIEVSFNHFGDRGRADLLAWHAARRILLVAEIKGELVDAQALLGALDVKVRLGRQLAALAGWPRPSLVLPLLIIRDRTSARERITRLGPLFQRFARRGRAAVGLLRHPERLVAPGEGLAGGGLLIFSDLRIDGEKRAKRLGSHRVRRRRQGASVVSDGKSVAPPLRPT